MPWKEVKPMEERREFVELAMQKKLSFNELCKRFGVSRKTGYKWLKRYRLDGHMGLEEQSRKPKMSPQRTPERIEEVILETRVAYPVWGADKIKCYLQNVHGRKDIPSTKTVNRILKRHGYITEEESKKRRAYKRFEHASPNDLWQADFKGDFYLGNGVSCHPLTILDDHSRYSIKLKACDNQKTETVRKAFIESFRTYGLPRRMNFDNGPPWGNSQSRYTQLTFWLIRSGIDVSFSSPYHPQTNGKDERFHRTLKLELLQFHCFKNLSDAQCNFDAWRKCYNQERPHIACEMKAPITRYEPSFRAYQNKLAPIEYSDEFEIRKVGSNGCFRFHRKEYFIAKYLAGEYVGLKPSETNGEYYLFYCQQKIRRIDLREE